MFSDEKCDEQELNLFIYLVEKDSENLTRLREILVFHRNGKLFELIGHVKIDFIEKRGLMKFHVVKFIYNNKKLEDGFINQIFVNIKDLYHEHTHHDGDVSTVADSLLPICTIEGADRRTSNMEILKQFQKKIIYYHRLIKLLFDVKHDKDAMNTLYVIIRQSKGEFIYALNFLKFYKDDIDCVDMQEIVFKNAITSIETFSEEANTRSAFKANERIRELTLYLVGLTFFLILVTIFFALEQEVAINSLTQIVSHILSQILSINHLIP